jgi:hypothetical protein
MRSENNTPTETSKTVRTKLGAWPPQIDERLRQACALGLTAAELAVELGRSRAAVSGRLHRLGVKVRKARPAGLSGAQARATSIAATVRSPSPGNARTAPRRRPYRVRTVTVASTPLTLADLGPHACRYCIADTPAGYMEQALFCAAPTEPGRPYCPAHHELACLGRKLDVDALTLDLASHLARAHF